MFFELRDLKSVFKVLIDSVKELFFTFEAVSSAAITSAVGFSAVKISDTFITDKDTYNTQNNKHKNSLSNIYSCQKNNLECSHIHNKNHEHGLVLIYSNRNWICNICNAKYSNDESTYFCSLSI